MSSAFDGGRKSQGGGRSIVKRITAQQVGELISLMLFFNLLVITALSIFLSFRVFAAGMLICKSGVAETYGAEPVPNILYDSYKIHRGIAEPAGWRLTPPPVAALFGAPDGVYVGMEIKKLSNLSLFRQWAGVKSFYSLPAGEDLYDEVTFTHDMLFFIIFRGLTVLLIIQFIVILRRAFRIKRRVRHTLRPITELTLAAQSINAAQAAKAGANLRGGSASAYAERYPSSYAERAANLGNPSAGYRSAGNSPGGGTAGSATAQGARPQPRGATSAELKSADLPSAGPGLHPQPREVTVSENERMSVLHGSQDLKLSGAIDTINTITERHLDKRIAIEDERIELKGLASAINGMLDRLDAAYQAQLRFVSDASHELRTPISVIQGYANLLDRWGKNDEKTLLESIDAIKNEADSMKELVEQLLFLARGDNHSINISMEDVDISALVEEVGRESKMIDETHEYQVKIENGLIIKGDYQLLKQALRILNDNSTKYTPPGGKITLGASRSQTRRGYCDITVRDDGIGIPDEALPHIFDRFFRADESRARSSGGTGLGLSIAKWIADSHQGIIDVVSRKDAGTKITLSFPEKAAGAEGEGVN